MNVRCVVCAAVGDAALCRRCTTRLERAIGDLPALLTELTVTITRQDRGIDAPLYAMHPRLMALPGVHYESGSTTLPCTPWPFAWDAANMAWTARNTIAVWVREFGGKPLLACIDDVRRSPLAGQVFDELTGLHADLEHAIDRRDPDVYAGRCDTPDVRVDAVTIVGPRCYGFGSCGHETCDTIRSGSHLLRPRASTCNADLWAHIGEDTVTCATCGCVYDMSERRAAMLAKMTDHLGTVSEVANALTVAPTVTTPGRKVTVDMLKSAITRGRIETHGVNADAHRLVRVGEVAAFLDEVAEKRPRRGRTPALITA